MGNECSNCVNEKTDKKKQWEYDNDKNYQNGLNQGYRYSNNNSDNSYANKSQQLPYQARVGGNIFGNNNNNYMTNKGYTSQQPVNYQDYNDQQNNQSLSQIAYNNPPQQIIQSQNDMSGYQKSSIFDRKNDFSGRITPDAEVLSHNQSRSQLNSQYNQNITTIKPNTNQSFGGQQISQKMFDNVSGNINDLRDNQSNLPIEDRDEIELENGAIYIGQWKGDNREGKGIQKWPDGAVYEGEWKNDRAEGKGKFYHANGDYFEGEWKDDKANGKGIYKHKNDSIYDGDWKDDHKDGYGIETWSDGSRYEGYYSQGKKHGKGKYQWSDGSSYDGVWSFNQLNGFGVYSWRDGRVYSGFWRNNFMHGKGKYTWSDGRYYEGEYENDKKQGYGTYVWIDKKRYEGYWFQGKQHGKGKIIFPDSNDQIKCIKYVLYTNGKKKEITQEEFNNIDEHQLITDTSNYFLKTEGDKINTSELGANLQDDFYQQLSQNKSEMEGDTRRPILISTQNVVDQNIYFKNANNLTQKQVNSNEGSKISSTELNKGQNYDMFERNQNNNQEQGVPTSINQNQLQFNKQNLQQNSSAQNLNKIHQIQQNNMNQNQIQQLQQSFTTSQNQQQFPKAQNQQQKQNGQISNQNQMKISQNQQFYTPNPNTQNQDHVLQNDQQQQDSNYKQVQFYNLQQQQQESQSQLFPSLQQSYSKQSSQQIHQTNQDNLEIIQRQVSSIKGVETQNSRINVSNLLEQGQQNNVNNLLHSQFNGQLNRNPSTQQMGQNKIHQYDLLQANGKVTMPTIQQQKMFNSNFDHNNQVNNKTLIQKQQY